MSKDWSHYYPLQPGRHFKIDGPSWYDGHGYTHERSATTLRFEIHTKWSGPFNGPKPFDGTISIVYRKEGSGNTVIGQRDGASEFRDDNAEIQSVGNRRIIKCKFKEVPEMQIAPENSDEADIDLKLETGDWYDFDFEAAN